MTNDVLERLQEGRKAIEKPENWIKGEFYELDDEGYRCGFCALGAIGYDDGDDDGLVDRAGQALANALPPDYFPRRGTPDPDDVPNFNDALKTTHDQVLTLFDLAIENVRAGLL